MNLLTGFRNLIGRKREPRIGEAAVTGAMAEIEAKPPEPHVEVQEILREREDFASVVDTAREVVQRLDDIDVRLGAGGTETQRLVKELDGRIEASTGRTEQLVQRLDARVEEQASDAKQLTERLTEQLAEHLGQIRAIAGEIARINQQCSSMLERIDEQVDRSQNHDDLINVAVGAAVDMAATRFGEALDRNDESLRQIRDQIDSTARSVSHADERSEGLVDSVRDIQGRTAGLDDAVTRIARAVREREDKIITLLGRTKRSMTLFAYGCTLASLLAIGIAAVAIFVN